MTPRSRSTSGPVEVSIAGLAGLIAGIVGFTGRIVWDRARPDGVGRWLLDTRKLAALGWTTQVGLEDGLRRTYAWYCRWVGCTAAPVVARRSPTA